MSKSKKGGLRARLNSALNRLEAQYEIFKNAKEDKPSWTTTRHGRPHFHAGRTYADECKRLHDEIDRVKAHITKLL